MDRKQAPLDRRIEMAGLGVILLAAILLRLWRLDGLPPGFTHDEAGHGQDAIAILHSARPLYETIGYGREPLYDYAVATAMAVTGRTDYVVVRWVSALAGLLVLLAAYGWVRRAFGPWEALMTCGWLAGSFWAVSVSRQALRSGLMPALLAAAVYAWWRGAFDPDERPRAAWPWFALSGVLLAATLWTYMAARVTWVLFLAGPLVVLIADRARFKRRWPGFLLTLVVAAALAAPMFAWLYQHPGSEQRFTQLDQPLQRLAAGDVQPILSNGLEALGMFTWRADDLWMYNLPGRPWLGAIEGALFYAGLVLAVWRWRRPQYALALAWLAVGAFPSLITGVSASATRAVAILPVLYLFPAMAVSAGASWLQARLAGSPARRMGYLLILLVSLAIAFEGVRTYHDYFDVWGDSGDVRVAYHTTLFEIAHDLDRSPVAPGTIVLMSSIYPGRYHDPYAFDLMLSRRDLGLRWMDGRGALVFPGGVVRLVVPALAPLDPALARALAAPHARLVESRLLHPGDLNPRFDVYEWDSASALQAMLAPPAKMGEEMDLGRVVALIGYDVSPRVAAPGGEVTLVTYWRVLSVPDPDLDTVLFTHLLAPDGIAAQQDRLDAPAWNWHVGEVFAQVHRLQLGLDLAAGLYPLHVGAYTRPGPTPIQPNPPTTRLTVYVAGQAVGDSVSLPPLQVER